MSDVWNETFCTGSLCGKLVEYTEMLLYYFKYRQCDPKTLELLIESFKMGGLVH